MANIHEMALKRIEESVGSKIGIERIGQAYFNAAYEIDYEWANSMRNTIDDPFYNDSALPEFLTMWEHDHPEE